MSSPGDQSTLDEVVFHEAPSTSQIPEDSDDLVVVQALSSQLEEPIGTIVVKSVFDTAFPARLKGIIDSDSYLVRVFDFRVCGEADC